MATLYMLHIGRFLPHEQPRDKDDMVGVSPQRRELLKAFGNWVRCCCRSSCLVEWNFANDTGLHRGGDVRRCILVRFVDEDEIGMFTSVSKVRAVLEQTKNAWLESRVRRNAAAFEN